MSNICSLSMDNTHNNVEFGVLQKTSKQSLISTVPSHMYIYILPILGKQKTGIYLIN